MPEAVQVGLFIHIVAVLALGGAQAIALAVLWMIRRAKTVQEIRSWAGLDGLLGRYQVFPALALVLLLSGGYLVNKVDEEWSEGWIGLSAVALIIAVAVGFVVNTPRLRAIGKDAGQAPDGDVPQALAARINDPVLAGSVHALAMTSVAIVWNMTTQPDTAGAFLAIVVLAAIGAASAIPLTRQRA